MSSSSTHHGHADTGSGSGRGALTVALVANAVLLVAQVVGGLAFGSLSLLADSVHQASDVASLVLALVIAVVVARPPSARYTFGLGRADALGALGHAALLVLGALVVVAEAVRRLGSPPEVEAGGVIVLALVGLVVNAGSALWLHRGHRHSLNVRGAALHLAADALGSLVALVAGVAVALTGVDRVDAALAVVIAVVIVVSAVVLARAAAHVLLDGVPPGVSIEDLTAAIAADPDVLDVHHLHVRSLDGRTLSLTAHAVVDTDDLHRAQLVTERLAEVLQGEGIEHVTLQVECHACTPPADTGRAEAGSADLGTGVNDR
ncbi:MAG: cation transporter [Actinomyces sp.]|nr:MAG: cation transporter [Actinomyces sp.]